jgi:hypothetical protein
VLSRRLCDHLCLGFAAWTLLCNSVVFLRGSLFDLLLAVCASLAAYALWLVARRRKRRDEPRTSRNVRETHDDTPSESEALRRSLLLALFLAAVALTAFRVTGSVVTLWAGSTACLIAGLLVWSPRCERSAGKIAAPGSELALWVLSGLSMATALIAHRPNLDDSLYLSLSAGVADFPRAAMLASDSLHGIPALPILLPTYRAQSIDVLLGALSFLTGLEPIALSHFVVSGLAAALAPMAYAALFRVLTPRSWLAGVIGAMAVLLLTAEKQRWYANFGLVRLHQGKAIVVTVLVPLIMAYGLEFGRRPSFARWLRLFCAHVCAIGLSASALWVAPVVAFLAVVCGASGARRLARTAFLGVAATSYGLILGLLLRTETQQVLGDSAMPPKGSTIMAGALTEVFGNGRFLYACLFAVLACWGLAATAAGRRVAILYPLAFFALFFNPYSAGFIARNVTGFFLYWRIFWVLPVPVLLALLVARPFPWQALSRIESLRTIIALCVFAYAVVVAPGRRALSADNDVTLKRPSLKTLPAYEAARALNLAAGREEVVLAPEPVAAWVPTFRRHAYPMVARFIYSDLARSRLGDSEVDRRIRLTRYVGGSGREDRSPSELRDAIGRDRLTGICVSASPWAQEIRQILGEEGFRESITSGPFEIWVKQPQASWSHVFRPPDHFHPRSMRSRKLQHRAEASNLRPSARLSPRCDRGREWLSGGTRRGPRARGIRWSGQPGSNRRHPAWEADQSAFRPRSLSFSAPLPSATKSARFAPKVRTKQDHPLFTPTRRAQAGGTGTLGRVCSLASHDLRYGV